MISEDECYSIIKNSLFPNNENFKLKNFEIKKASDDNVGFLGEYYNLITEIENENSKIQKLCFFVKTIPQSNLEHKKIVQEIGVFKKEEKVYKLFQECNNFSYITFHPKCLFTKEDLIVLEDLSILNYYQLEEGVEYNLNQVKAILSALSRMHALSIAYEAKNDVRIGDLLENYLFETSVTKEVTWFLAGLEAIKFVASKHPKFQTIEYQNFISKIFLQKLDPVCDMVNTSSKYRNVLCHRDVWGRNIFFKDDANNNENSLSSILVDYQTCRYCPPAIDILFLLHLNTRHSFRNKIHIECLNFYHQMLIQNLINLDVPLINHISKEEIFTSCKELKLFGVVYDCIAATIINLPKGYLTNLKLINPKKYFQFSNVNRNDIVAEFLETDTNYREYLFQAVDELMEIIF